MSARTLAEGVIESIRETTPRTRNRYAPPRYSITGTLGWIVVAASLLLALSIGSP